MIEVIASLFVLVKTDTELIRVLTDVIAAVLLLILVAIVADNVAITVLLLLILVAIVDETVLILVCNVAEVPILAYAPAEIKLLIEVIASLFVFVRTDTALILVFTDVIAAVLLPILVAIVADSVAILVCNVAEVPALAKALPSPNTPLIEVIAAALVVMFVLLLLMLVAIVADKAAILVCRVAEVPALAKVLPSPNTPLIEVIASLFVLVKTETAAMFVLLLLILVAIVADKAVIAALLLLILVAIAELTEAIRDSKAADVPALATPTTLIVALVVVSVTVTPF